ncbi:MAG: hypothetical protein QG622_2037 [Actinomycetota bacterium]|nr:hypothetical protein [Actinomycetota bacterium]
MNELSLADVVGQPVHGSGRRSRRNQEKRRKKRRRRTWVTFLLTLVVIGGAVGGAWVGLRPLIAAMNKPSDYPGPGTGSVEVKVPDGATGAAIGDLLQEKGVVLTVKGFVTAYKANPRSATIQPGTYAMKKEMTSTQAVEALLTASSKLVNRVTLKEGVRVADIPKLVAAGSKIPIADLQAVLKSPGALGLPAEAKNDPEGWLFPATYDIEPGMTATELLSAMVRRTVQELDAAGVPAASRHDVIVLASLIQAEAGMAEDFPKVSRVLHNRLAKKRKLELDTTVHYATKKFTVFTSEKDTKIASPYNTYIVPGLPVGAIGNPGKAAIQAAQAPSEGSWMYFVAVNPDTGQTKYATTEAEFAKIKAEYEVWQKANPGK